MASCVTDSSCVRELKRNVIQNKQKQHLQKMMESNVPPNLHAPTISEKGKTTKRGTLSRPYFAFRKNVFSILRRIDGRVSGWLGGWVLCEWVGG